MRTKIKNAWKVLTGQAQLEEPLLTTPSEPISPKEEVGKFIVDGLQVTGELIHRATKTKEGKVVMGILAIAAVALSIKALCDE